MKRIVCFIYKSDMSQKERSLKSVTYHHFWSVSIAKYHAILDGHRMKEKVNKGEYRVVLSPSDLVLYL